MFLNLHLSRLRRKGRRWRPVSVERRAKAGKTKTLGRIKSMHTHGVLLKHFVSAEEESEAGKCWSRRRWNTSLSVSPELRLWRTYEASSYLTPALFREFTPDLGHIRLSRPGHSFTVESNATFWKPVKNRHDTKWTNHYYISSNLVTCWTWLECTFIWMLSR